MAVDRAVTKIADVLLAVMFIAIFVMVFYQVVLRYVFNSSIFGTAEVFTMLFSYSSALGAAVMLRNREHIKISVFTDRLPTKVRKVVLSFDYVLIAVFSYFIVRQSIPWLRGIRTFRSPVTGITRTVQSIAIPISFALIIFYCLVNLLSLYLSPEERALEFSSGDSEARHAIEEIVEVDGSIVHRKGRTEEGNG